MSILCKHIRTISLKAGQIAVQWIGQAGFLIKTDKKFIIAVDPYLTDSVEKTLGSAFKRLMMPLFSPEELLPDLLLITHNHEDHYDIEAVPVIMAQSDTHMVCCPVSAEKAIQGGIDKSRVHALRDGEECRIKGVTIRGVFADHGDLAPEAIGFLLTFSGTTFYFVGDSAYVPDRIKKSLRISPDILVAPINGAYGNLNGKQAALLAKDVKASVVIPCHFWTFAIHKGNPQEFIEAMLETVPEAEARILCQGEVFIYDKNIRS